MRALALAFFIILALITSSTPQTVFCGQFNEPCWTTPTRPINPGAGTFGYNITIGSPEVFDGARWNQILDNVVKVVDFGAICDNVTDDSTAINNAISYARSLPTGGGVPTLGVKVVGPSTGRCFVSNTINLTNIQIWGFTFGPIFLECATTGQACVDMYGTRFMYVDQLTEWGAPAPHTPSIGIQIGRINSKNADLNHFNRPVIQGNFTFTPWYGFAAETTEVINGYFTNYHDSPTSFGIVQDGCNHWGVTSQFVAQTLPPNTCQSFNQNTFVGGSFGVVGTSGTPMWISNGATHRYINMYGCICNGTIATDQYGIILYPQAGGPNLNGTEMLYDIHFEPVTMKGVFYLSGTISTPVINGLHFIDHKLNATTTIFAADTGIIMKATLADVDLRAPTFVNSGATLVDTPNLWNISGDVSLPSNAAFNATLSFFYGCVTIANSNRSCYTSQSQLRADRRITKTADYVMVGGDAGSQFDNIGALGSVTITLPAASRGLRFGACAETSNNLVIDAPGTATISIGTSTSIAGGNVTSNSVGSCIQLEAVDAIGTWRALSSVGTWAVN